MTSGPLAALIALLTLPFLALAALLLLLVGSAIYATHHMATASCSLVQEPIASDSAPQQANPATSVQQLAPSPQGPQDKAQLDSNQLENAGLITTTTVSTLHLPPRAAVIAVAVALQESNLRNLPSGTLDSVGLFQQRASWGSVQQRTDPATSTTLFDQALVKVPNWQTDPLGRVAQEVQRSADSAGDLYARWEGVAAQTVAAALGNAGLTIVCQAAQAAYTAAGAAPLSLHQVVVTRAASQGDHGLQPLFPWVPAGGWPTTGFAWGQCTWWASFNIDASWHGNADQWFANAAATGRAETNTPVVGTVVVWRASPSYSSYGHVGVVIGASPGQFELSEMNYADSGAGTGVIDNREDTWPDPDVEGFIYPPPPAQAQGAP